MLHRQGLSRIKGTIGVPTTMDPSQAGGVRVVSEAGKGKPLTAIIVARKATKRVSAGKRRLIQTKSTLRHDRDGTTLRVQGVP